MAQNDDEHITRRIIIVCNMLTTRVRCCLANDFVITCCQPTVQPLTSTFSVYSHSLSPFSLLGEKVNGQWRRHETAADEIAPLWVRRSSQPLEEARQKFCVFPPHSTLSRERFVASNYFPIIFTARRRTARLWDSPSTISMAICKHFRELVIIFLYCCCSAFFPSLFRLYSTRRVECYRSGEEREKKFNRI